MILTRQGRIIRFNRACEQTTGYSFEEVKGKYWWDVLLPAEEVETIRAEFNKLGLDQPSQRNERYWITKAGQRRLIVWSNTVLLGHKGEVEYILHSAVDLTERKQIEEALRETRNKLEQRVEERTLELSNANAILMQEIAGTDVSIVARALA